MSNESTLLKKIQIFFLWCVWERESLQRVSKGSDWYHKSGGIVRSHHRSGYTKLKEATHLKISSQRMKPKWEYPSFNRLCGSRKDCMRYSGIYLLPIFNFDISPSMRHKCQDTPPLLESLKMSEIPPIQPFSHTWRKKINISRHATAWSTE